MNDRRNRVASSSRRTFLKTAAGVAAGTALGGQPLAGQRLRPAAASAITGVHPTVRKVNSQWMITPDLAWDWNAFKSKCGPTYAGSKGWKRYTDFLVSKLPEFGAVDLDHMDISYDNYI